MNLREFLKFFLYFSAISIASLMLESWHGWHGPLGLHELIAYAIGVIALSMGAVGLKEMNRRGHRKARRNSLICLVILYLATVAPTFARNRLHMNIIGSNIPIEYCFILWCGLFAAMFPLALYLNRKQLKSTLQPTPHNAS